MQLYVNFMFVSFEHVASVVNFLSLFLLYLQVKVPSTSCLTLLKSRRALSKGLIWWTIVPQLVIKLPSMVKVI